MILTFKQFKKTRKKVDRQFMIDNYGFEFQGENYSNFYYVYGIDGNDGYIEINDTNGNNTLKYFLNISNWDDVSNDLEYFENKLYNDHYLYNV